MPDYTSITNNGYKPNSQYNQFAKTTGTQANRYLSGNGIQSPYDLNRFKTMGDDMYSQLTKSGIPGYGGSGYGGYSSSGYADSTSPRLMGHLNNLIGGTRGMAEQGVRNAAYAGPNRGGMNTVGGADPRSAGIYNMVKGIAGNYGDNYKTAADLTYRDDSLAGENWRAGAGLLSSILGYDLGAQQGAANFGLGQAGIGRDLNAQVLQATQGAEGFNQGKYYDDLNYARGEYDRNFQREQQRIGANREQSNWMNRPVDPAGQIPLLESVIAQYNTRFPYGDSTNMVKKSDWLAKLQGVGPYGSGGGGGGGQKKTSNYVSSADSDFMNIDRSTSAGAGQSGGGGLQGFYNDPYTKRTYRTDRM